MNSSGFRSWAAYRKAFQLARRVFRVSAHFPPTERNMIDQMRRSTRSICANLGEVYAVRSYPKHYRSKLAIAIGENLETQVWLELALDVKYITPEQHANLHALSEDVGKLLSYMQSNQTRFAKWKC